MKQFYSIHEGEYLAGICINKAIKNCDLWIPAKDRGVDILLTNKNNNKKNVSLQIKHSKDYTPANSVKIQKHFRSCGWWRFGKSAVKNSLKKNKKNKKPADFWVFTLHSFSVNKTDCIVIKTTELYERLSKINKKGKSEQTYFWITKSGKCFETRDIEKLQKKDILDGKFNSIDPKRDFTRYLNKWDPVKRHLGVK